MKLFLLISSYHLEHLRKRLNLYSAKSENIILLGDFNVSPEVSHIETLCESYGLRNLVKVPTCYKNPQNPSCINLILTNSPMRFQSSGLIEIKMTVIR